jgi:Na+-transporting NADH:ubiquinone oxidoreductase subunit NqrF
MKRKLITTIIVALLALAFALPVAAMGNGNIKGEITAVTADNITILLNKGEVIVVSVPLGYDTSGLLIDDSVLVRGTVSGEGTMDATTIKVVGGGDDDETEEGEEAETEDTLRSHYSGAGYQRHSGW